MWYSGVVRCGTVSPTVRGHNLELRAAPTSGWWCLKLSGAVVQGHVLCQRGSEINGDLMSHRREIFWAGGVLGGGLSLAVPQPVVTSRHICQIVPSNMLTSFPAQSPKLLRCVPL